MIPLQALVQGHHERGPFELHEVHEAAREPLFERLGGSVAGKTAIHVEPARRRALPRAIRARVHDRDDEHPDYFYQMRQQMTVFGFGRRGLEKFLDAVPQSVSIGLVESTDHGAIGKAVQSFNKSTLKQ